jgi:hypothetical protein
MPMRRHRSASRQLQEEAGGVAPAGFFSGIEHFYTGLPDAKAEESHQPGSSANAPHIGVDQGTKSHARRVRRHGYLKRGRQNRDIDPITCP